MSEKNEVRGVVKGALARWPIVILAAVVVGGAAFAYAVFTTDGPSKEAVSSVRYETVVGVPALPTVDMGVAAAKSLDLQASAAESAGVSADALSVETYVDPSDVSLLRIAVRSDDPEAAVAVADAMADLVTARTLEVLEPELGQQRGLIELAEERLDMIESRRERWTDLVMTQSMTATEQAAMEIQLLSFDGQRWQAEGQVAVAQFNFDRFHGAVKVEGEAVAVDVSRRSEIIGMSVQGVIIGLIAGVAVAFLLSLADVRRRS